ncbi:MAG: hypothetical protein JSS91_13900 [Bacteroidetes bacterium]|nr:hypothetical protein [Bacteroidota bacterium]
MTKIIKKVQKKPVDENKETVIRELTEILEKIGFSVRIEKGSFKGGFCILNEQKLFLINKNLEQDKKISIIARSIAKQGVDDIYIKPGIREIIERENSEEGLF